MAVTLHRCSAQWVKLDGHPCWRVEKALQDEGLEYTDVLQPAMPWQRKRRTRVHELTGAYALPVIEFENGHAYREESADMAKRIRAGKLFDGAGDPGGIADAAPDEAPGA